MNSPPRPESAKTWNDATLTPSSIYIGFTPVVVHLAEAKKFIFFAEDPIEEVAEEASANEGPTRSEQKKVRLDDLFSVAEALERSHQPDFCDVTDTAARVEGSATHREIIRDCLLCGKQLFGRHALSRHLRNVHSRVFGPYSCPVDGCGKSVEDGVAFKNHLQNNHVGPRAMAAAKHER